MKSKSYIGVILLFICSFLWGSTFVAQEETTVEPFTYLCMRSVVAVAFLIPVVIVSDLFKKKGRKEALSQNDGKKNNKTLIIGGTLCGVALFLASAAQQIGIFKGSNAGKAGFITAMYLLIVPIFGLFLGKKVRRLHWLCIAIALCGLFLLTMTGALSEFSLSALFSKDTLSAMSIQGCDVYVIACAFLFSVQILFVDKYSSLVDCLKLSLLEFTVVAVLSVVPMFIFETPTIAGITSSWLSIVWAGILSSGVAYTLQIFGQKYTNPAVASMIMGLEATFAVISAIFFSMFFEESVKLPTPYETLGCVLMFFAIILSQLPEKKKAITSDVE